MRRAPAKLVNAVLQSAFPDVASGDWVVSPMSTGGQGSVYRVRSGSGGDLVVKLFHLDQPHLNAMVIDEFDCLQRLAHRLDGRAFGDWMIRTPDPLFCSLNPAALVMTFLRGKSISELMRDQHLNQDSSIPAIIAAALGEFWQAEHRVFGDCNLRNILCDPEEKTLALLDCGMPDQSWLCAGVARDFFPASRDLAYLLYSAAVEIRRDLFNSHLRQKQRQFTESIVLAALHELVSEVQRPKLLAEIQACIDFHLAKIKTPCSPRGLWRRWVKRSAEACLVDSLQRLRVKSEGIETPERVVSPVEVPA